MTNILIVGATSSIAEATARRFAAKGARLYLLARNGERLSALASDLQIRGAQVAGVTTFDASDLESLEPVLKLALESLGSVDVVLIAHGNLPDQKACQDDVALTVHELNTNAVSIIAILTCLAGFFESQRHGTIAVIGSVAGDRGRQSNYIYGTAKGAIAIFLQGLRNRLYRSGVQVLTIKPGFVDTPMTAAFKKGPLWATPESVAVGIERAIAGKSNIAYLPGWWRYAMWIIRSIPERLFVRLSL